MGAGSQILSMNTGVMTAPASQQVRRVIHKTLNGVVTDDQDDYLNKKKRKREVTSSYSCRYFKICFLTKLHLDFLLQYVSNKGWKAPIEKPYQSLGQFANVAQAFE